MTSIDGQTKWQSGGSFEFESAAEHVRFESVFGLTVVEYATGSFRELVDELLNGRLGSPTMLRH